MQESKNNNSSDKTSEILDDSAIAGVALSTSEVVFRFGNANAEYLKGLTGADRETGQNLAIGLIRISRYKLNADPAEAAKNIKQQAGFSAEVATTSRDNAESIINRSEVRTSRSDDLPQYGRNHNVVDRVQTSGDNIIGGTESQMKFVGNRDELFEKIAKEDGKFARYRGTKLELPSEQYVGAAEHCKMQAESLRLNAERAEQAGKPEVAQAFQKKAENYDELSHNIRDSGLTTEQAIFYRTHPRIATAVDIAYTSHRAGIQGAQYGAVIGSSISLLRNLFSMAQGDVSVGAAAKTLVTDTATAAAVGYASAAAGSAIKGVMQQSSSEAVRTLSKTSAPALVVAICISLGSSINSYVKGEITEAQLLVEFGEKGAGMLSSGMMAALGQLTIPVPFLGAAVGGMIGYTLSSMFYHSALDAARGAEMSRERLEKCQAIQTAARECIAQEQAALDAFLLRELPALTTETRKLFSLTQDSCDTQAFADALNDYATLLGAQLQFESLHEFESFMKTDQPLKI